MEDGVEGDLGKIAEEEAVSFPNSATEGVADLQTFEEDACVIGYCDDFRCCSMVLARSSNWVASSSRLTWWSKMAYRRRMVAVW